MRFLWRDLRYAFRALTKAPGFTAVAVLSLAIGIGANTSIFSVIDAVLLRPLPFPQPERLVMVNWTDPGPSGASTAVPYWSYPRFRALRERSRAFEDMAGYDTFSLPLTEGGHPEKIDLEFVTASYFRLLGITPFRGRVFLSEEDRTPGTHPVAILGHELWQRRYGGDPRVMGRTISINRVPLTVVGILPPGFRGLSGIAEVWTPVMMTPAVMRFPKRLELPDAHWMQAFARLGPGVSLAQAHDLSQAAAASANESLAAPRGAPRWGVQLVRMSDSKVDPILRTSLLVLLGAVGFVLLIACANVANLMLARAAAREKEVAIRLALGAGRWRLVRQLIAESVLLGLFGGIAALVVAMWGIDVLSAFKPGNAITVLSRRIEVPGLHPVRLDSTVLAFNVAVSLGVGVLFGLLPAFRASRPNLSDALKQGPLGRADGAVVRLNSRAVLVSGEVALALSLLIGAGLMIRSFANVRWQPLGFEPDRLLTLGVDLPFDYDEGARKAFYEQLTARIAGLPGVESAAAGSVAPLMAPADSTLLQIVDTSGRRDRRTYDVAVHAASPGMFATLRIPLLKGRSFTQADRSGAPPVAVISETAAKRFFPGKDAIGKRLAVALFEASHPAFEVIGVVGDVKYGAIEAAASPNVYLSWAQHPGAATLFVRTKISPAAILPSVRRAVTALDKNVPVYDVRTMAGRIADATARARFSASLLAIFAAIALALAGIGVYGLMAYSVQRRVREIGVRVALGAGPREILTLVLGDGLALTAVGLLAGLAGSFALTRVLSNQLYGITATDPLTFIAISAALACAALLAAYIPARRALKIDPLAALRYE